MASRFLNNNFDYTQRLIESDPQNENNLIADYNNLIIQTQNNARLVRNATYRDSDNNNNMPNIKIMNNFQRYGYVNDEQPIFIPTTQAVISSSSPSSTASALTSNLSSYSISSNISASAPASPAPAPASPASAPASPAPAPASPAPAPASPAPAPAPASAQTFKNKETFQNYFDTFIKGGFKDYYNI